MIDYAFSSKNAMAKINMERGEYISCELLFRGDITPKEVVDACVKIKDTKNIRFVDWCPTSNNPAKYLRFLALKADIVTKESQFMPEWNMTKLYKSLCMVCSNTDLKNTFKRMVYKYDMLYAKRAFVHW
jgi:tubulin alpha